MIIYEYLQKTNEFHLLSNSSMKLILHTCFSPYFQNPVVGSSVVNISGTTSCYREEVNNFKCRLTRKIWKHDFCKFEFFVQNSEER